MMRRSVKSAPTVLLRQKKSSSRYAEKCRKQSKGKNKRDATPLLALGFFLFVSMCFFVLKPDSATNIGPAIVASERAPALRPADRDHRKSSVRKHVKDRKKPNTATNNGPARVAPERQAALRPADPVPQKKSVNVHVEVPKGAANSVLLSLQELTRSPPEGSIQCNSRDLTPIYDKVVFHNKPGAGSENGRMIPRIIHVSFNSRCVPNELAESIKLWSEALPDHSIFFHDDEAVDRFMHGEHQLWRSSEDFPDLQGNLRCVMFKGAMLIDIWRMLIVWTYGGIYTDIDNWPGPGFTKGQTPIRERDSFFSLTDSKDRPSQWLFGMVPHHPIAIYALQDISRRLLRMKNIARPRLVAITGPQTLRTGYRKYNMLLERNHTIFPEDLKQIQRVPKTESAHYALGSLGGTFDEIVDSFYDERTKTTYRNISKREKTQLVSGLKHWTEDVKLGQKKEDAPMSEDDPLFSFDGISCKDYLAGLDAKQKQE